MESTSFEILFNRADFEEIFYANGQGKIFLNQKTRPYSYLTLGTAILALISLVYSVSTNSSYHLFIILFLLLLAQIILLYRKVQPTVKWKKQIKAYLDREATYTNHKIAVSDNTLSIIQDKQETIQQWSQFKSCVIAEAYISLIGTQNYLIPKKSMSATDYDVLKSIVSEKVKM